MSCFEWGKGGSGWARDWECHDGQVNDSVSVWKYLRRVRRASGCVSENALMSKEMRNHDLWLEDGRKDWCYEPECRKERNSPPLRRNRTDKSGPRLTCAEQKTRRTT